MTPDQRLAFLADKLDENANNPKGMRFDLEAWLADDEGIPHRTGGKPAIDCGTTGCAVGLAMLLPEFQAEGFHWNPAYFIGPEFERHSSWSAVNAFFGLNEFQSGWLFTQDAYNTFELPTKAAEGERAVAARIRDFISKPADQRKGSKWTDDHLLTYEDDFN